ncbi:sugar ABC transporter substrate-binding protein [Actinosynnema sp. NPDC053489]|uniref:sugar ABC transporter substrate-binding protein n=1 Tax=Actinosynnema sp. NPDC053489 TaxID=3363916 RepID=UPI0037CBB004
MADGMAAWVADQVARASSGGTVVQAGRDVVVSVDQRVRRRSWAGWRRTRTRRAFLVTSAFDQKYWLAGLTRRLHAALDRDGVALVLKVPDRDFDSAAQAHHLRRVLSTRRDYVGGFVVATEVERAREDLAAFCVELDLPVVFTDVEPFELEDQYPDNAAFVGYPAGEIGATAGRWLVTHFHERGITQPRVLIVAGEENRDRQRRCAEVIREAFPGAAVVIDASGAFKPSRAHDAVLAHLHAHESVDAVFCTNDEMALGAVDALRSTTCGAVVVGVDGTVEATALIDAGTSALRATVVQDPHRLAESAVRVLERLCDGRPTPKRTALQPEVHQASNRHPGRF